MWQWLGKILVQFLIEGFYKNIAVPLIKGFWQWVSFKKVEKEAKDKAEKEVKDVDEAKDVNDARKSIDNLD